MSSNISQTPKKFPKRKSTTTEPIRDKTQARALIHYYLHRGKIRNYTLITMGIYTALRISDLLSLSWGSVYSALFSQSSKTSKPAKPSPAYRLTV